ncbi:hypothetical protein CO675_07795 [Bradyrhizobium sp. C9]|nr:hypothetical protein CO675_07795 [Bradyrhizobium sp. C9]
MMKPVTIDAISGALGVVVPSVLSMARANDHVKGGDLHSCRPARARDIRRKRPAIKLSSAMMDFT